MKVSRAELLCGLPPAWAGECRPSASKVVVLDDDPTGTQTVHGVPVLTEWSVASLASELAAPGPCFFVLTNSRALPVARACALNREIGLNLVAAAGQCGRPFQVVSRSDSTLRGHFPLEIDALAEALGGAFDALLIVPAFFEGGRLTVDDIHYVADGESLAPAGETEFARDASFGYRASNLRDWVEEKTEGRVPASRVASIPLADLRGNLPAVASRLLSLSGGEVAVVNAAEQGDLSALTHALAVAEAHRKRFLFRTAASFVCAYAGIRPRPLLRPEEIAPAGAGRGLVVVGSHIGRTSLQLAALFRDTGIARVEVAVESLLDPGSRAAAIEAAAQQVESLLGRSEDVTLHTSRRLVTGRDAAENLAIGETVSSSLVAIVTALRMRPRWLIAKGGITSSDLATRALGVKRAMVLGQAIPGVPVWLLGPESRWPGLAYVVFPGNVGGEDSLARLVTGLR